ncbi:MAG: hypothetical protein ABJH63_18830 [Rhizobiaceae bacterium]
MKKPDPKLDEGDSAPKAETAWRKFVANHEAIKNFVQALAIFVAGIWIASVWLYDNWAAKYLQKPWARLSVEVVKSGSLKSGDRFAIVKVTAENISKRRLFNYGNAMTIRAVEFDSPGIDKSDLTVIEKHITQQTNRQRSWVYDFEIQRSVERIIAYSQYMSQGYTLQPTESFVALKTIPVPSDVEAIDISARLTYGASHSIFAPDAKVSGGLAVDKNNNLSACAKKLDSKRQYKTSCEQDYSDEFYIRSSYAESTYVFLDEGKNDKTQ